MGSPERAAPECYSPDRAIRSACRQACTAETCPLDFSYWDYLPSYGANGTFLALFSISMIVYVVQAVIAPRRFMGFSIAMICGSILEVLGYAARVWAHLDPWREEPFLLQIVTLTIAPAFYAAGIYFCLSQIVTTFGAENSRIPPVWYPRIFIACDFISLVFQAAGGGMASAASHSGRNPTPGNNTMIAGLAFQVFTLLIFMLFSADFAFKTWGRVRKLGKEEALDPKHQVLRDSWKFKGFLIALTFATLCIFCRCVYRVAELSAGWDGYLVKNEDYFIGLEGAVVVAAVLALNLFHPAFCFREAFD